MFETNMLHMYIGGEKIKNKYVAFLFSYILLSDTILDMYNCYKNII